MKNLLGVLFLFLLITGCNNERAVNDGGDRGERGSRSWSSADRKKFINECVQQAGNNANAREFCTCLQGKAEAKFSSYDDQNRNGTEEEGLEMGRACRDNMGGGNENGNDNSNDFEDTGNDGFDDNSNNNSNTRSNWSQQDRSKFLQECMNEAGDYEQPKPFCNCLLQKTMKKFKSYRDASRGTEQQGTQMAQECLMDLQGGGNNDDY